MAEKADKKHPATPKRLADARKEGQTAKSTDLASALVLLIAVILLMTLGKEIATNIYEYSIGMFSDPLFIIPENTDTDGLYQSVQALLHETMIRFMKPLTIFFLILAGLGVLTHIFQVGFMFLPNKIIPKLNNISPLRGLKNMFSLQAVVRLGMGIVKIIICSIVAWFAVEGSIGQILNLTGNDENQIANFLVWMLLIVALKIAIALLIIAVIDYTYQRWKFHRDLRMTDEEVKDEMKNMLGDPQVLSKRKQIQREMAMKQRTQGTPDADVVVTNPTHLSVAIKFDARTMNDPVVVAKGADYIAFAIRRIAAEHGIPVVEKKPLARALYEQVEIGEKITNITPQQMSMLVEVVKYAYRMTGRDLDAEMGLRRYAGR